MINIKTIEVLKKAGYTMSDIRNTVNEAEKTGSAQIGGWVVRYNEKGDMIVLHPSHNGIYIGDYTAHLHFEKTLAYTVKNTFFTKAKYGELAEVLKRCDADKNENGILCECPACDFERRKKQVEKLGYKISISNYDRCSGFDNCKFVIF